MGLFSRKSARGGFAFGGKKIKDKEEQLKKVEDVKVEKEVKKEEIKEEKVRKSKKEVKEKKERKHDHKDAYKNLIRPIVTEKSSFLGMNDQYVFEVSPKSNKIEIKKSIKALYGVEPIKINIVNVRGKSVRYGRNFGNLKSWKKVIVTLKQGDKIEIYEGV